MYCNIEKRQIVFNSCTKQTKSAKVISQKGNSPDRKLKCLINTKNKIYFVKL